MSVIVKGMDIPATCILCPMQFGGWCYVSPPEIDERVAPSVDEAFEQGRPDWCPLVEIPEGARLIDAKDLKNKVLKWLPPDPCGIEERERSFETDICVSMLMEIDEAPTVF